MNHARFLLLLGAALILAGCATSTMAESSVGLALPVLGSMDRLRSEFDRHAGRDRLLLFLSPT